MSASVHQSVRGIENSNGKKEASVERLTFPKRDGRKIWLLGHFAVGTPVPINPRRQSLSISTTSSQSSGQGELTAVVMVGGEKVFIDTMPETLIGAALPAGPV
jgi:hypothetical protein